MKEEEEEKTLEDWVWGWRGLKIEDWFEGDWWRYRDWKVIKGVRGRKRKERKRREQRKNNESEIFFFFFLRNKETDERVWERKMLKF